MEEQVEKVIVLDLDDTLVVSHDLKFVGWEFLSFKFTSSVVGKDVTDGYSLFPHYKEFLLALKNDFKFKIVFYSAGTSERNVALVEEIRKLVFPNEDSGLFSILSREDTVEFEDENNVTSYLKNPQIIVDKFGINPNQLLIVDDRREVYSKDFQEHVIQVPGFDESFLTELRKHRKPSNITKETVQRICQAESVARVSDQLAYVLGVLESLREAIDSDSENTATYADAYKSEEGRLLDWGDDGQKIDNLIKKGMALITKN